MEIHASEETDYSGSLFLRCPRSLPLAVKQAARKSMTSASSYVRSAVLHQLKIDGCSPSNNGDRADD
jgi:hypothetical protein